MNKSAVGSSVKSKKTLQTCTLKKILDFLLARGGKCVVFRVRADWRQHLPGAVNKSGTVALLFSRPESRTPSCVLVHHVHVSSSKVLQEGEINIRLAVGLPSRLYLRTLR